MNFICIVVCCWQVVERWKSKFRQWQTWLRPKRERERRQNVVKTMGDFEDYIQDVIICVWRKWKTRALDRLMFAWCLAHHLMNNTKCHPGDEKTWLFHGPNEAHLRYVNINGCKNFVRLLWLNSRAMSFWLHSPMISLGYDVITLRHHMTQFSIVLCPPNRMPFKLCAMNLFWIQ